MKKPIIWVLVAAPVSLGALILLATSAVTAALGQPTPPPAPVATIPGPMLDLYASAAASCPGLPWQVLAAIGTVESGNGTSDAPGVHSGHNGAGAEGPMQFEPATFAAYSRPVPSGGADPPSPYDPADAVYAAARMLCADGGARAETVGRAVWEYNHSATYVARVLQVASDYGLGPVTYPAPDGPGAGTVALEYALAQVGTPYRWGGEAAGVGFDCSGLVQAAYAAAGVAVPRVAQDQYDAGPAVPAGVPLRPGDLVFFGTGPAGVDHVGLVVDPAGVMVDAPHTGAAVRVEAFTALPGASWGGESYLGATDPGAGDPGAGDPGAGGHTAGAA